MSTFVLLAVTGVGLGALYYLIASGLSLTYGLMRVLNFAHGIFLTTGAYAAWAIASRLNLPDTPRLIVAVAGCMIAGAIVATAVELSLVRPLYHRHIDQILVTVGLALAFTALVQGVYGADPRPFQSPSWTIGVTNIAGAAIANSRLLAIGGALFVFGSLAVMLRFTRWGLIVRAGVENRAMVTALGIDVGRIFTLVFAIGGVAAALGGALGAIYFGNIDPERGTSTLIFAFIVIVIGGLGSFSGTALAAVLVGVLQQFANYYGSVYLGFSAAGDLSVMLLLAVVLLTRPQGLLGRAV
ncbi:MAG: branched-chain amino acid ABC transporter permease [Candidatus Dormibacteraceae bacterium]